MSLPRGYRNNNPGNVQRGTDRWQGMSADQSADARFIVFDSPEFGIRCVMRLLIRYYEKHRLDTVRGLISRWAPANGIDPTTGQSYRQNTDAYIEHVCRSTGIEADQPIDLFDRDTNLSIAKAIIRHELGNPAKYGKPAEWYDEATYAKAMALAGFAADQKPLTKSRTIAGSILAGTGAVAGAIYDSIGETVAGATQATSALGFLPENWVQYLFLVVILLGVGRAIYARMDDEKRRVT